MADINDLPRINDLIVDAFLWAHDGDTRAYPGRRELVRDSLAAVSVLLRAQWEAEHQCVTVVEEGPPEFFIDAHDLAVIATYAHDAHCNTIHEPGPQGCPPAVRRPSRREPQPSVPSIPDDGEAGEVAEHQPRRGSAIEAWLKAKRDTYGADPSVGGSAWWALDDLLDDYRYAADFGEPLGPREEAGDG